MAHEFEFPDTGEGVTEGKFVEWLVEEGDEVEEDQALAEVETDKAVVEVPSPGDGTITELKAEEGDVVEVGEVILEIETDEDLEQESKPQKDEEDEIQVESRSNSGEGVLALPKVRKLAEDKGVDLASIKTGERITEEEVIEATGSDSSKPEKKHENSETSEKHEEVEKPAKEVSTIDAEASPAVRRLAREKGIDLETVTGSGRNGRIIREDIVEQGPEEERVELSQVRKTVAKRMTESKYSAPHVTHIDTADVTELVETRQELNEESDAHITFLPFVFKSLLTAMKDYPNFNAEFDEDAQEVVRKRHYDFNIAVDTDRGLLSPIIRDVEDQSIEELAYNIEKTAKSAREGSLPSEGHENGTFTITNIGAIGGEGFTPIINYPQTSILGLGEVKETAEVFEGEIVPRKTLKLSLSYDHRVIDGAMAARFLNSVKENLENPEKLMLDL